MALCWSCMLFVVVVVDGSAEAELSEGVHRASIVLSTIGSEMRGER